MRTSHRSGAVLATALTAVIVTTMAATFAGLGSASALAATAVGTSDAGIVPVVIEGGPGGNVVCGQVPSDVTLSSSERLEWRGNRLVGSLPDGLVVQVVDGRSVTWSSDFPIAAVIVKGGDAANVYLSVPPIAGDSGLVAPVGPSGKPADVSNVTFCWDPDPSDPPVDLLQVCMDAAVSADVGPIVSVVGPIEIRDGAVVPGSVPSGLSVDYDAGTDEVGFIAPFPVAVVVTATSAHTVHHITPPSTSGTVPLSSNPGHGDVVLCGLDALVVSTASCAMVGADLELGPVPVRGGAIDPADLPEGISSVEMNDVELQFTSTVLVAGVLITASPTVLHTLSEPTMSGAVLMSLDEGTDAEVRFCALRQTVVSDPGPQTGPGPSPTSESVVTTGQDPVLIATGGGPPARTSLGLFALVILALTGSTTMLLWSRGG
jgi:hypothetical protein